MDEERPELPRSLVGKLVGLSSIREPPVAGCDMTDAVSVECKKTIMVETHFDCFPLKSPEFLSGSMAQLPNFRFLRHCRSLLRGELTAGGI